jgi:hypothetical protein
MPTWIRKRTKRFMTLQEMKRYAPNLIMWGRKGRLMRRPERDKYLLPTEVQTAIHVFFGRPIKRTKLKEWANSDFNQIGPKPVSVQMPDGDMYEFYNLKEVARWLNMSMVCREHRAFARTEQALILEARYGYGAIPNSFRAAPNLNLYNMKNPDVLPERVKRYLKSERKRKEAAERVASDEMSAKLSKIKAETRRADREAADKATVRHMARSAHRYRT